MLERNFPCRNGEEQVAQRSCGYGSVQDQFGWSFKQSGLVVGVPAHGRGVVMR